MRKSTLAPTICIELVANWPDFVGVKDASGQGVEGVIVGKDMACTPTVFCMEWLGDIKADINNKKNPKERITNSDLEMAGLLLIYLLLWKKCVISSWDRTLPFSVITHQQ